MARIFARARTALADGDLSFASDTMSGFEQAIGLWPGLPGASPSPGASTLPSASTAMKEGSIAMGICGDCGVSVGFQPLVPEAEAARWYCQCCNSICFAKADPQRQSEYVGVAPLPPDAYVTALEPPGAPVLDDEDEIPSRQLLRLLKRLCNQEYCGVERRRYRRYPLVAAVTAVSLDEHFRIVGLPVRMATTNISHDGISLIHQSKYEAAFLAIDFSEGGFPLTQAVVRPVRTRSLGVVHETGGRFVRGLTRRAD